MPWAEARDGAWRAGWRDAAGKRRYQAGFRKEADALRYAGEQEGRARRGEVLPGGRSIRWGEWCDQWIALRGVEGSTARTDRGRIEKHIRPRWGDVPLARITREGIQEWVNGDLAAGRRPGTVLRVFRTFSASLTAAVKYGRLAASPATLIDLPSQAVAVERYLTREELDAVLYYLNEPYRLAVVILAGTGLRFGELAGLHWSRVDLEAGMLHVVETYDYVEHVVKPYPKGGTRKLRAVPIASWVRDALLAAQTRADGRTSCGQPHLGQTRCRSGLVIYGPRGAALDANNVLPRHWAPAVDLAGIGHVRLHDLRHTFASWLIQAGRSIEEVSALLGHESITTTQRYSHLAPARFAAAVDALEGFGPGGRVSPRGRDRREGVPEVSPIRRQA